MRLKGHWDEFDDLAVLAGSTGALRLTRSNHASSAAARRLTTVVGPNAPIIDRYLDALSYAPEWHLTILERRGARIVFGPSVDAVLTSSWADERRPVPLTWEQARQIRMKYGPESGIVGLYDPETDILVFPTSYCCHETRHVVLHELGHALTVPRAQVRRSLIQGLPRRLHRHVYSDFYVGDTPEQTLRQRVLEALAEGYIYVVDGKLGELPAALASELMFMLQSVEDREAVRFEFEDTPAGERTASRASQSEIVDASDPEHAGLFAPVRLEPGFEPWDLVDDELSARRRRRVA